MTIYSIKLGRGLFIPHFCTESCSVLSSEDGRQHLWHGCLHSHEGHHLHWQLGISSRSFISMVTHTYTHHHVLRYILCLSYKLWYTRHTVLPSCTLFYVLKEGIVRKIKMVWELIMITMSIINIYRAITMCQGLCFMYVGLLISAVVQQRFMDSSQSKELIVYTHFQA